MQYYPLLKLLADGRLHSGAELAGMLGVSRTAVWKQLQYLENLGLSVEAVRGHGYRLVTSLDLLDCQRILERIPAEMRDRVGLETLVEVESTNQRLLDVDCPNHDYEVCTAEQQTSGRGRRGRNWESPFAQNIYLSFAYETEGAIQTLQGLTLVAGSALLNALETLGIRDLGLKWPNDIWLRGRKVAGILTELQGIVEDRFRVVIGMGLNVYMSDQDVSIDQPWTSLANEKQVPTEGRNAIVAAVIRHLVGWLDPGVDIGSKQFLQFWREHDVLEGREITVAGETLTGTARGIDRSGRLRIEAPSGIEKTLNAGEVSVRVACDDSSA